MHMIAVALAFALKMSIASLFTKKKRSGRSGSVDGVPTFYIQDPGEQFYITQKGMEKGSEGRAFEARHLYLDIYYIHLNNCIRPTEAYRFLN